MLTVVTMLDQQHAVGFAFWIAMKLYRLYDEGMNMKLWVSLEGGINPEALREVLENLEKDSAWNYATQRAQAGGDNSGAVEEAEGAEPEGGGVRGFQAIQR